MNSFLFQSSFSLLIRILEKEHPYVVLITWLVKREIWSQFQLDQILTVYVCSSLRMQEEQKVIEAKIRMRQQELQDDEEREQRRGEDIRAGRIGVQAPRPQAIANHQIASAPIDEIDVLSWRSGWGSTDRQSQVRSPLV
jgi:hypothetical protein